MRLILKLIAVAFLATACTTTLPNPTGTGGKSVYRVTNADARIQYRMLDAINALRQNAGLAAVELSPQLNAAAATHARDMAVQNRPWHFGSDGSSPIERAQRAGYTLTMLGENISETYETELETLAAWMDEPATKAVIMDQQARHLGFAWYQESGGKIWWTMLMGGGAAPLIPDQAPYAARIQG